MLDPSLNFLPESVKTIHIMGICGTGMAALAGMLQHSGYTITGSDGNVYPPMSDYLKGIGISPMDGYSHTNLDHFPDLVIVGNVITKKNPEALALKDKRLPYLSFPQALAEFYIASRSSIVITGTHGKTTTCSLLASSMFHAGLDPSFMIGGIVSEFSSNNRIGNGNFFIAEGDEYDTAFFDKGSKFLHYRPEIAVITSIEFDHADIFDDLDQIKRSFRAFVTSLPPNGLIIANLDDENVAEVVGSAPCAVRGYGFAPSNYYQIRNITSSALSSSFTYSCNNSLFTLRLPLSGRHNCLNALAVAAVLSHIGLSGSSIQDSFAQFQGVKRRQEIRGREYGVTVIDDFAHHPTAVRETLEGLKKAYPGDRLIAVFEPRTNSSRRSIFQKAYVDSFNASDLIVIREPVPLTAIAEDQQFSSAQLSADLISQKNKSAWAFDNTDEILTHLNKILQPGDVVAVLSNGGFDNIHERLLTLLKSKKGN